MKKIRGKPQKYLTLAEQIMSFTRDQGMSDGDPLPSERRLSELFECNHLTVRRSLKELERAGQIHKIPSTGSFVGPAPVNRHRSGLMGVIFPVPDRFCMEILVELEKRMARFDASPVLSFTYGDPEREESILQSLVTCRADGIIALPGNESADLYKRVSVPLVFVENCLPEVEAPAAVSDDFTGATVAVEHLLELGHTRIAFVGGTEDEAGARRLNGFRAATMKAELDIPRDWILQKEYTRQWGMDAARELFRCASPPTAVFCANDSIAAGVYAYAEQKKILCPDHVSIMGFSNSEIAGELQITSMDMNAETIAETAWQNLRALFKERVPPIQTNIGARLVQRKTTAKPTSINTFRPSAPPRTDD